MKFSSLVRFAFSPAAVVTLVASLLLSCATAEPKAIASTTFGTSSAAVDGKPKGATIEITVGGPADTVRAFYKLLRDKKFREALFLTNLRPAIESLTDTELKEFSVDFEAIAGNIPTEIEINGEIITGESATVMANLPDPDDENSKSLQEIKLNLTNGVWIIQTADAETEAKIKKDGKNYFFNLRIETHEEEAGRMLERVAKAQIAWSLQHANECAELATLVTAGLLPGDITSSASTGYNYAINVSGNKRRYFATATPAEYGKTGRKSFLLDVDEKGLAHVSSKDNGGKPLKN